MDEELWALGRGTGVTALVATSFVLLHIGTRFFEPPTRSCALALLSACDRARNTHSRSSPISPTRTTTTIGTSSR